MENTDIETLAALFRRTNPFAMIQPNPSLTLDTQNSWGRTQIIREAEKVQVVKVQLPIMAYVVFVARAIEFDNGTNETQLYPYARIKYGNGNVLTENLLDITGGWMESVVGSTFEMEVFLADAEMYPPDAGSNAYAKIQGFACVGVSPYPERNAKFYTGTSASEALVFGCEQAPEQGRLAEISGFVDAAGASPSYLIVWDSNLPPADFGGTEPPILYVVPIGTGLVSFDKVFKNTRPFINGVSYGLSSSPTAYIPTTATAISVTAETLRDS